MHAAEGGGLGNGPAVGAADRVECQVLGRAPEVLRGVAVEPARVDGHITVERGVVRVQPEAGDLGVEPDLRVDVVVRARLEHQRVAAGAELGRLLLLEDLVDLGLDAGRRGVEDQDVGSEIAATGDLRAASAAGGAEHLELPERVPVLGRPGGAGQPHVAGGAGDVQRLVAPRARGGRVGGAPGAVVRGELDLVALGVGGLPPQRDLADRGGGAQVDLDPLRVGGGARPAGAVVAVHGGRGGGAVVLLAGGGHRLALREQRGCRAGGGRRHEGQQRDDETGDGGQYAGASFPGRCCGSVEHGGCVHGGLSPESRYGCTTRSRRALSPADGDTSLSHPHTSIGVQHRVERVALRTTTDD